MSKIVFFSLPAHGHVNPTLSLVSKLIKHGHEVMYYGFDNFKDKIEKTGAKYVSCDDYLPIHMFEEATTNLPHILAIPNMLMYVTANMQSKCISEITDFNPDCIIHDSLALWGRLYAEKLGILPISSTTTFIFNKAMSKRIPLPLKYLFAVIPPTIPSIPKYLKLTKQLSKNFEYGSLMDMIMAKEDEYTITYTSKLLQSYLEPNPRIKFVGTMIDTSDIPTEKNNKPKNIYISLGTLNNQNKKFYKNCFEALKNYEANITMSVGKETDISSLGEIPSNFNVQNFVNQLEVLKTTDIFLTHGGMNSVNEGLANGIPLVVFPQQPEQTLVATQVESFGAGIRLKKSSIKEILLCINEIMDNKKYEEKARIISQEFKDLGGATSAVQFIEDILNNNL